MSSSLEAARQRLLSRLDEHESTRGLYVRTRGQHLILGRQEAFGPKDDSEDDNRVRLTHLQGDAFGLSVMRHTGRWERTPFVGTVDELFEIMIETMQHLLAPWS